MPSKITLTFSGIPATSTSVKLKNGYSANSLTETFVAVRTSVYQSPNSGTLENAIVSFAKAFNVDYNAANLFTVIHDVDDSTVEITHPNSGFFDVADVVDTTSEIGFVVVDTADASVITIDSVGFSESVVLSSCKTAKADVTTSALAVSYRLNGGSSIVNALNPFSFESARGSVVDLEVEDASGSIATTQITFPDGLVASQVSNSVTNSPDGATLVISVASQSGLDLEYSLDDITYQTENSYENLIGGDYTIYIKDQLGCSIEVDITIQGYEEEGVGVRVPFADLPSKSNSLRFYKYTVWGDCGDYKNDENTISCDLPYTQNNREGNQLLQSCDVITTQIKTNYKTIVATVIDEDENETTYPVVKKSSNIGLEDMRDAIAYNLGGLGVQTGIYFTSGDTYDYDSEVSNGTYLLNGALPYWGSVGNFLKIGTGWYEIVSVVYDDTKNAYALVIDLVTTGVDTQITVKSIYNQEAYDIHEFEIDMSVYEGKKIQVNITQTDDNQAFSDVVFLSEVIDVQEVHENTIEILYYNDANTDIFYATGIQNKIRVPVEYFVGGFAEESQSEKTDSNTYLIDSEAYENDSIVFQLLTKEIMRKLIQALSHKFVFLNEVQYVKEESTSVEPVVGTNLYRVEAKMTKANGVYTSHGTNQELNVDSIEVPSLLEFDGDDGYIKI